MHLLFREQHGLDAQDAAQDLAHPAAPLLLMSFTDSDLLGLRGIACPARDAEDGSPEPQAPGLNEARHESSLQVVNLQRLRHPMSVDLYLEQTAAHASVIVVRLLGGVAYWRYGVEELITLSRKQGIALALLPGACEAPEALRELSTVDTHVWDRLHGFFREGGARNWAAALRLMHAIAGLVEDDAAQPQALPQCGVYRELKARAPLQTGLGASTPVAWILFYRAHLVAGDTAGIDALMDALAGRGFDIRCIFVASLRQEDVVAWLEQETQVAGPDIILNATFFSARRDDHARDEGGSVLEGADVPVIQLLQPGATRAQWAESMRGLSQSDIAMQVALPERDGRLIGNVISFKEVAAPGLPTRREAAMDGIQQVVAMACGWTRLAVTPRHERRVALILSDYPGAAGQMAHAVGLDGFASIASILGMMETGGYDTKTQPGPEIASHLRAIEPTEILDADTYARAFSQFPTPVQSAVIERWGAPDGAIRARFMRYGAIVVAVQPHRATEETHKAQYHDPDLAPGHQYLGFYLWLRMVESVHALIHLGTHGTTEWLPGKAVALSPACFPAVLTAGLPVIYPFIVNNPGEAATAKRRLGAVTIGHLTPPMRKAGLDPRLAGLERLIDEYAEADGMDRRRGQVLREDILRQAQDCGLSDECRLNGSDLNEEEALARLDAWLCDIKDLQIREGLHVYGQRAPAEDMLAEVVAQTCQVPKQRVCSLLATCPDAERRALIDALDGRFVPPGPAGAPTRGRLDVLPTGRNLTTLDPRHLPTRAAYGLAETNSQDILRRHLQEEGKPLRHLVMDVWGSATFRTGGEDLALALALMGVQPQWSSENGRLEGFEIIPLARLDRPRVDVTLRISGMFRDGFPGLIALYDQVVVALASRAEPEDWNALVGESAPRRVFGAAPQKYGTGVETMLMQLDGADRDLLGARYTESSAWVYSGHEARFDAAAFRERLRKAELLMHVQDHAETDLLDSPDWAAHEGGLSAAAHAQGAQPKFWHGDSSNGQQLRLRTIEDEIARVTRGRLTNPVWLASMRRHDYRGAAEIARSVAALCSFAVTLPTRFDALFDRIFAATLADDTCDAFLRAANPEAREDIRRRLAAMWQQGKWTPRQNSAAVILDP